ncbi:MAG: PASTA domain-containing protein, partial [Pelosinus sp.]|nr:PASTA domain-containing protein [Pelosinus sp.]
RIAGKTGTAQKVGAGGYMPGKYIASFAGFGPVDNPEVAMLVVIDEPVGIYYGGQIAAPVFNAVMKDVLQYLKVSPLKKPETSKEKQEAHVVVPSVINLLVPEAIKELQKAGLSARVENNAARITDQIPKPGSRVPAGATVLLHSALMRYEGGEITVPDIIGKNLRDVSDNLAELGLTIDPSGVGEKAVRQQPAPGTRVPAGTEVTVYFE